MMDGWKDGWMVQCYKYFFHSLSVTETLIDNNNFLYSSLSTGRCLPVWSAHFFFLFRAPSVERNFEKG